MTDHKNYATNVHVHRLYVVHAMEHLAIIDRFLSKLAKKSEWFANSTYNLLNEHRKDIILQNTAYQEAVWRRSIGQVIKNDQVYDLHTQEFIPINDQDLVVYKAQQPKNMESIKESDKVKDALKDTDKPDSRDGVPLKSIDQIVLKNQQNASFNGEFTSTKSHTNKLTTEQRRENGRKGALIRDNRKRSREAIKYKTCIIYAVADGQIKNELGRRKHSTNANAFGSGEVNAGTCESYVVFDAEGWMHVYDPAAGITDRKFIK